MEARSGSSADEVGRLRGQLDELTRTNEALAGELVKRQQAEHELREQARESRLIVDSIPGLVALLSPGGELESVNRQAFEYFGQTLDELKRWGETDVVHPDDLPHVIEAFTQAIVAGSPYEIVQRFRRFDG
jgi:PAS domain-containing protein